VADRELPARASRRPPLRRKGAQARDHLNHAWVKTLYHVDVDDSRLFSIVVDASRFSPERVVEILLAAGGVHAAAQPAIAGSSTL
jgi:cytidylate kinase